MENKNNVYHQILKEFLIFRPEIIKQLKKTSHHYDLENLNEFHLEGDIYTHTLLAYNHLLNLNMKYYDNDLLICSIINVLCHDIGKLYTREENHKKKKITFYKHSNASVQFSIDFIYYLNNKGYFNNIDTIFKYTLPVIDGHNGFYKIKKKLDLLFNGDFLLKRFFILLGKCDLMGSIIKNENISNKSDRVLPSVREVKRKYKRKMIIISGLPGAGKLDIVKKFNLPIYSFSVLVKNMKKFNNELKEQDNDIVMLDCHLTKKSRKGIINTFKDRFDFESMFVLASSNKIYEKLNHKFSVETIFEMSKSIEMPSFREGFYKVSCINNN